MREYILGILVLLSINISIAGEEADCPKEGATGNEEVVQLEETVEVLSAPAEAIIATAGKVSKPKSKTYFFFDLQYISEDSSGKLIQQSKPTQVVDLEEAVGWYAKKNGLSRKEVLAQGNEKLEKILREKYKGDLTSELDSSIKSALLFKDIAMLDNEPAILATIRNRTLGMSFKEKVDVLAVFLKKFGDQYDNSRTDSSQASSKGSVLLTQLMGAARTNLETGSDIDAGVCRDMHQGAAKLAVAMGISEAFGIGFRSPGGGHRTLILTDPHDRGKVYNLNYGNVTIKDGMSGTNALSHNGSIPDTGLRYRIYNADSAPAIILPSSKGGLLNRVTGGKDSQLDPFYVDRSTLQQAGMSTKYGVIRMFNAQNQQTGESIVGGAYNVDIEYFDAKYVKAYGSYGVAGYTSDRETTQGQLSTNGGFARTTQGLSLKLRDTDNFRLTQTTEINGVALIQSEEVGGEKEDGVNMDFNVDAVVSLKAEYGSHDVEHTTELSAQVQLDNSNALDASKGIKAFVPTTTLSHKSKIHLDGPFDYVVGADLGFRNLNTGKTYSQYRVIAGVENKNTNSALYLSTEGAISRDLPIWVPGSERKAGVMFRQGIGEHVDLNVSYSHSFEHINNDAIMFGISGKF